ncbi:F-box/kelch-repeat protein At3g06240-like [Papaver somniferum]|nr:F-box/kelch-repeat protein At3g06240-like [Papaver somniferum]
MKQNAKKREITEPVIIVEDDDGEEDEKKVDVKKLESKKLTAATIGRLPALLLYQILIKLPAKSVLRFRCVSIGWNTLLKHPKFISNFFIMNKGKLKVLMKPFGQEFFASIDYFRESSLSPTLSYRAFEAHSPFAKSEVHTFSSVYGIIFVEGYLGKDNLCLWNPATREFKMVSKPKVTEPDLSVVAYAFGYFGDYKIVRARKCYKEYGNVVGTSGRFVSDWDNWAEFVTTGRLGSSNSEVCVGCDVLVYSLRAHSWKKPRQASIPYDIHVYDNIDKDVYFDGNGNIIWKATRCDVNGSTAVYGVLLAFHTGDDTFREVPVTPEIEVLIRERVIYRNLLAILDEHLCILNKCSDGTIEIWSMRQYSVRESWTRWKSIGRKCIRRSLQQDSDKEYFLKPIWDFKNGEVLFIENYGVLVLYDIVKNKRVRVLKIRGVPEFWLRAVPYVESLVPLNTGKCVQGRDQLVKGMKTVKEPQNGEETSFISYALSLVLGNGKRVKVEHTGCIEKRSFIEIIQ